MTPSFGLFRLSLPVLLAIGALAQWDDGLLRPFVMNHRSPGPRAVNLSFLLDPPAGKSGFVRVRSGHLVTADGKRLRLWGVHLTDWSKGSVLLPPKEDIPMWADTLARYGVNCVRLHFLDLDAPRGIFDATRNDSRGFDARQMDRLDFLVAELKQRGIYVDLNLNVGRSYKAGDGVADYASIRWGKGLTFFDPRLIELQKEYAKQILTHRNPYTKTEYRNEPAVAIVEIANENALPVGFQAPTPYYDEELTRLYNEWVRARLSPGGQAALRAAAGVAEDALIPRLKGPEVASAPKERFRAEMSFCMETEDRFFQEMTGYLKNTLGVRVPVIGTADHSHSTSGYPLLASLSRLDIVDGHVYWQHPGSRGPLNTPMVNDPLGSTVVQLSRTAFAGKPYTVSEINHPFPNEWADEGMPIIAAYGAFQDWDAIILYTFEPKLDPDWKSYVGDPFDISLDPVRMTQLAAGALAFLRGDVRPALETVERTYSAEQVVESRRLPGSAEPYFTPGFPLSLPLRHGVRIRSLNGPPTGTFHPQESNPIVSDTGELAWYLSPEKTGLVAVETARTQALVGFVKANRKVLRNLSVELTNSFASVVLTSLDGLPLARSGRMLLTAGSRVANTGMRWNETRTRLISQGGPPSLIEPVAGRIVLRNLERAQAVTLTPLDGAGAAAPGGIAGKRTVDGWELPVGDPVTPWYVVTVRR